MKDLDGLNDFENWPIKDKFFFFDNNSNDFLNKMDMKVVQRFLNDTILNSNENLNIRKNALDVLMNFVLVQKIKKRVALNLLLDQWFETGDVFLEITRLKNLFILYDDEPEEIEDVYKGLIEHEDLEIKCESLCQLGLIYLLKANVMNNKSEYLNCLTKSLDCFRNATSVIENRIDAEFFTIIITDLINIIQGLNIEYALEEIAKLLWKQRIFSYDGNISPLQVGLYRILNSIKNISIVNPTDWLDFRKEFNELCYFFYEMKNQKLKNDIINSSLLKGVSDNLIRHCIEPIFAINFSAEICRIDKRLNEVDEGTREQEFLLYLKRLASGSVDKEQAEIDLMLSKLQNTFPKVQKARIESELKRFYNVHSTQCMFYLFDLFSKCTYDNLLDAVISSCINIQGNRIFWDSSENERNTFIASSLEMAGFYSKDQTLWGKSRVGKTSGEIDIFIKQKNGEPFTIIEALNLDSLNKDYLNLHLDKIFSYDTTGLKYNFILVYSSSKKFSEFWQRYVDYIRNYKYPYPLTKQEELDEYDYTDIRICKTTHIRNSREVYLYHIMIDMDK